MIIGIVCAMELEGKLIADALQNKEEKEILTNTYVVGNIKDNQIILVQSGCGKVNSTIATTLLIDHFHPDLIINSGIAGGSKGLITGDIVIADKIAYSDFDLQIFGYPFATVPHMPTYYPISETYSKMIKKVFGELNIKYQVCPILSSDTFRMSHSEFHESFSLPFACDMEGASIAQTCYKFNTPFISIRFISDILDSENHVEDYHAFENEACNTSAKITLTLINEL